MKSNIIYSVVDLPEKIRVAFHGRKKLGGSFILSFKTLLKPNATVPILWFTLLSDGIAFLNTHKTRCVFKEILKSEINCIRLNEFGSSENIIEIVSNDIYEDDFAIPIPGDVDLKVLQSDLIREGYSVSKP